MVRVAVTGHRPNGVPAQQWRRIRTETEEAFAVIEQAASLSLSAHPRFALHTALAEGADRLVTEMALARHWRINVFLPFSEARYRRDFSSTKSLAQFDSFVAAAASVTREDGERLEREIDGDAPYAAVGRSLIERTDLLLCIWNGTPPKGPGGTSEVAALMLERGGLVLWIPADHAGVKLVGPAPLPRAGSFRRKLHEALAEHFERTARPPEMRVA